jgi:prepilin-type N-terminal cleavage/methylation domain-containing protein
MSYSTETTKTTKTTETTERDFQHATRPQDAVIFKKTPRRSSGFTLIETIVALTILAIGVLGVAAGLLTAMKVSTNSRSSSEAIFLAEQQLETFKAMSVGQIQAMATGGGVTLDVANNPINPADDSNLEFIRSWQIQLDTPATNVITLTVTVDWTDNDDVDRTTQLQTFRAASG